MNNLKWIGHSATIFDIQKKLREDTDSCEITLVGKDSSVRAHRLVLASCSDLMKCLMADLPNGQEATIIVPDIKGALLDNLMAFIYIGETNIPSSNISDFIEAMNTLGIKSAISFECKALLPFARQNTTSGLGITSLPVKALDDVQVVQDNDIIDEENMSLPRIDTQNIITTPSSTARELEFLDVYSEGQPKITYSIEHASAGNEYIFAESASDFGLSHNSKLETASSSSTAKNEDMEDQDENDEDGVLMDDFNSSASDAIIDIDNAVNVGAAVPSSAVVSTTQLIQVKSSVKNQKSKLCQQSSLQFGSSNSLLDGNNDNYSLITTSNLSDESHKSSSHLKSIYSSSNNEALELAAQEVLNGGISLQKAAAKFEVSKTVLWRRMRKDPNYQKASRENPLLTLACDRLKNGESMKNISKDLDIPMSTLHRHKVRLSKQGRLPDYVTFKKRDFLSKDQLKVKLEKAVHACVHEGMSQNHAANLFDVPKSTLWRHLQKRVAEAEMSQAMSGSSSDVKEEVILS